jgi:hypothetical protein
MRREIPIGAKPKPRIKKKRPDRSSSRKNPITSEASQSDRLVLRRGTLTPDPPVPQAETLIKSGIFPKSSVGQGLVQMMTGIDLFLFRSSILLMAIGAGFCFSAWHGGC